MTVCYELPVTVGTYTIEYNREAEWHSQWAVHYARNGANSRTLRRYATYTEARRAVAQIKRSYT